MRDNQRQVFMDILRVWVRDNLRHVFIDVLRVRVTIYDVYLQINQTFLMATPTCTVFEKRHLEASRVFCSE